MSRSRAVVVILLAVVVAIGLAPTVASADPPPAGWATSWAAAPTRPQADNGSVRTVRDTTLRQVAHLSAGGDAVRVTLSNEYGTTPLRIGAATVGTSNGGGSARSLHPLTFAGVPSVTVPAGGRVVSDAVSMTVASSSDLAVSTWFPGRTGPLDVHPIGLQQVWSGTGNRTSSAGSGLTADDDFQRYVVTRIDVHAPSVPSVVFFGDSITDGFNSTPGTDSRYPDQAHALAQRPFGVANVGISANQLLVDGDWAGDAGVRRFGRDVLQVPGVTTVVVLIGINDVNLSDATARALEDGYRSMVSQAHAAGVRVVGATILPEAGFEEGTPAHERVRQQLNTFIRTSGIFDDVVDLDAVVRDPADPTHLRAAYDSGDHLHPDDLGYRAMGAAVATLLP